MLKNNLKILSLGCGIQSSTLAEMIVEGEMDPVDYAIFSDTGNEPAHTYQQKEYLEERLASVGIPLITVNNGNIIDNIKSNKDRFAAIPAYTRNDQGKIGMLRRQCTNEFKLMPLEKEARNLMLNLGMAFKQKDNKIRIKKGFKAQFNIGISLDEATRMGDNKVKAFDNIYPLIDERRSRHSCSVWLQDHGLPVPGKSACIICPFHTLQYWKDMKNNRPEEFSLAVVVDDFLRSGDSRFSATAKGELFLHKYAIPLKEIDSLPDSNEDQSDFFEICDGYCMT